MSVQDEILALEATWGVAPLEGDLETVDRVTAEDWIGVGPWGEVMGKADLLEMLSSRPAPFETATYDQVRAFVYGPCAVVTSLFRGQGKEGTFEQRFMRVYAYRDGRWQCVATQIVPIPEQGRTP
jgi:ketosteroid isomerase-like protein